jgi:hypothetical protein
LCNCARGTGVCSSCRETALIYALSKRALRMMNALLAAGADVHCKNNDGYGRAQRIARLFHKRARRTQCRMDVCVCVCGAGGCP